jgi:hypothetical protein
MQLINRRLVGVMSGAVILLTACGADTSGSADDEPTRSASSPSTATALPRIGLPVEPGATVEGPHRR